MWGSMAASRSHGGWCGMLRDHILNRKHRAKTVNWKWYKASNLKACHLWRVFCTKAAPPKQSPNNISHWGPNIQIPEPMGTFPFVPHLSDGVIGIFNVPPFQVGKWSSQSSSVLAKVMKLESGFPRTRSLVYCQPRLLSFPLHHKRPNNDHWHRRSLPRMLLKGCSVNTGAYLGE